MKPLILIIDDEAMVREMYADILTDAGYQVIQAPDGESGLSNALNNNVNLVLVDLVLTDMNGIDVLSQILKNKPSLPVIMISGYATIGSAVQAVKIGAYDFLEKPIEREKMLILVRNALALDEKEKEIARLRQEALKRYKMVGFSPQMQEIFKMIDNVAQSNATVLITGESGVGKELVARAIHNQSKRSNYSFVKINCAAMPETLIESELFGYEKGAFTGAYTQKKGKLEIADLGTLFMDEVCDLSLSAQAKLLRFMQEGEFERVGGNQTQKVDVRILAATNKNINQEIVNKNFREDLYYRLNVIHIYVPPLRERKEEIGALADYFLEKYCEENGVMKKRLSQSAIEFLMNQSWPGNVRQLENLMERASILIKEHEIKSKDLIPLIEETNNASLNTKQTLKQATDEFQKAFILKVLAENNYNKTKTAKALDIQRVQLYKKLKALGIDV